MKCIRQYNVVWAVDHFGFGLT